jgi:hypothetical protein
MYDNPNKERLCRADLISQSSGYGYRIEFETKGENNDLAIIAFLGAAIELTQGKDAADRFLKANLGNAKGSGMTNILCAAKLIDYIETKNKKKRKAEKRLSKVK